MSDIGGAAQDPGQSTPDPFVRAIVGAPDLGAPTTYVEAVDSGRDVRLPWWGLWDLGAALLIAILAPSFIVLAVLAAGAARNGALVLLLSLATPWLGFALYPVIATRLKGNGPRIDLGWTLRWSDVLWGLGGGLAALVLGGLAAWLTEKVTGPFDSAAGNALANADVAPWVRWAFLLCAVVGAPAFEELCFRGLAFASVAKAVSHRGGRAVPWATIASALLFALIHFEPVRVPVLLTIGLVLSVLRARTGRVGASMIAHAFNNSWAVAGILGVSLPSLLG